MGGIWMLQKKDQACPMNMQNLYRGGIKWVSCSEIEFSRFRLAERRLQNAVKCQIYQLCTFFPFPICIRNGRRIEIGRNSVIFKAHRCQPNLHRLKVKLAEKLM